jgi:EAL domain-containing protein (putative c-di-GMP-specific phosphodiesterase class I)
LLKLIYRKPDGVSRGALILLAAGTGVQIVADVIYAMGVRFSIDDFGTGYSSLAYLQDFPIQAVKIDRSFIEKMRTEKTSEIVRTIIAMAHELGLDTIAEGIENETQLGYLKQFECQAGQGYYLSRPQDNRAIERLLQAPVWPSPLASDAQTAPST